MAEIEFVLARLPDGVRADGLRAAASALWATFASSILPFETSAAIRYGRIVTQRERMGRPASAFDAQIAAIAASHGAGLATRNIKDFEGMGLKLIDPWEAGR